jgi:uncharacterized protein (TIGR02453 family)
MTGFDGFPKDFFAFFRELKANNDRAWFEDNKQRFKDSVQAPMSDFIAAMAPALAKISKEFVADPRPNGGSMFRIHRDVRFARDKRPYKEHAACQFRHRLGRDVHAPGFYVHIAPDEVFFGGGLWMPDGPALAKIRERIASRPGDWKKIVASPGFKKTFGSIEGEQLTRPPRGFDPNHPFIESCAIGRLCRRGRARLQWLEAFDGLSVRRIGCPLLTGQPVSPINQMFILGSARPLHSPYHDGRAVRER